MADADAGSLDGALGSVEEFAALQQRARTWLEGWRLEHERLGEERDGVRDQRFPIQQRQSELRRERASLEDRAGRMPARMHELRAEVAKASGLDVAELPFVAELIDVAPEEARWRTAIETVLGGTARLMLVPIDRLEAFSAAIDGLHLRGRLTFEGVELDLPDRGPGDPSGSPASCSSRTRRSPAGCRTTWRTRLATRCASSRRPG